MPPLDLPRQVMRRAGVVALAVVLLALGLGLLQVNDDIAGEADAAMTLANLMAQLGLLSQSDDHRALAALRAIQDGHPLRHLELRVHAGDGRLLLAPPPPAPAPVPLRWLLSLHRELLAAPDARRVAWQVTRPDGGHWTVSLTASHEGERREAMANLGSVMLLLLLCVAGLLLVMRWNVRQAFAPLGRLLAAIAGIELRNAHAVLSLPTMPIRELEAVAAALRHLGGALEAAEVQRRLLSQQVLTLQEDERARLARELHDEFGQRLTALRVDAAWLARRVAGQPALMSVVEGMSAQCERVQGDIRALLTRLQPFGPDAQADDGLVAGESLARLADLLQALVASWAPPGRELPTAYSLDLVWREHDGSCNAWPAGEAAASLRLARPLLLTLYRISQEALTNVARHAGARQAVLRLQLSGRAAPGAPLQLAWSVTDDGSGVPAPAVSMQRGNGIAGIQERVWAQGGDLRLTAARPGSAAPGLCLQADFSTRWLAARSLPPSATATATAMAMATPGPARAPAAPDGRA